MDSFLRVKPRVRKYLTQKEIVYHHNTIPYIVGFHSQLLHSSMTST